MANDTSDGFLTNWNVDNVNGNRLISFSPLQYPFLARVNGAPRVASTPEFAMAGQYALESDAQTAITEEESVTAPTAIAYDTSNETNYIQIFHQSVNVTYTALASQARLKYPEMGSSGSAYTSDPLESARGEALAFSIARAQEQLYGTLEHSVLNGTKTQSTGQTVAGLMGGVLSSVSSSTVDASTGALTKGLIDELLLDMAGNGAFFRRPVIFCNAFQKQSLSKIYEFVPMDRNVGGSNIQSIETDFGQWEVVYSRRIPTDDILFADMDYISLATQPVPGKDYMPDGLFLYEELSKTGASEKGQMFGQLSVDFGSEKLHGSITNLATS